MMPYETDPAVLQWFEQTLQDPRPNIRRHAVELLEHVDSARRDEWLAQVERDPDARVAGTAVLVRAALNVRADSGVFELLESDFADAERSADLEWEWEYLITVCEGPHVPMTSRLVFLRDEDDDAARRLAVMKACAGRSGTETHTPVIVDKRLVNRYTRSPRSMIEAQLWKYNGRPHYREERGE